MAATWKTQLHPFAQLWDRMERSIPVGLGLKSDKELESLIRAASRPTSANCWYATYHVAEIVAREAQWVLDVRKRK